MKKVFFILFASAALAFNGCKSTHNDTMGDSTQMRNDANEATQMVDTMHNNNSMPDTSHMMNDTMHK